MKRPLAVIGFSGMIAQCLAMWLHPSFSLIAGAALLGVGMILLLQRSVPALRTAALAAGVVMLLTGGMQWVKVEPVRALDGMTAEVIGTVADQNASDGIYLAVRDARIVSADGRTLAERQKLRIYLSAPIDAAQVISANLQFTLPVALAMVVVYCIFPETMSTLTEFAVRPSPLGSIKLPLVASIAFHIVLDAF